MQKVVLEKEKLEELWVEKKLSLEKIAAELGTSVKTVRKNIKEYNISKEVKLYTQKEWLYQKHYVEKLSRKQIAEMAKVHENAISKWMKRNNLEFDKEITHRSKRKYQEKNDFFDKIDGEEKAYWMGFLMADGNIKDTVIRISLSKKDKCHLEKFLKSIESNRKIIDYEQQFDNGGKFHKMCNLNVANWRK